MPRGSSLPPNHSTFNPITGETQASSSVANVNDSFSRPKSGHSRSLSVSVHRNPHPFPVLNSKGVLDDFGTGSRLSPSLARTSFDASFKLSEANAAHWQENPPPSTQAAQLPTAAAIDAKKRVLKSFQSSPDFPLPATLTTSPRSASPAPRPSTASSSSACSNPTFQSTLSLQQAPVSAAVQALPARFHADRNSRYSHSSKHATSASFSAAAAPTHNRCKSFDDFGRIRSSIPQNKCNPSGDVSIIPPHPRRDVNVGHSDMITVAAEAAHWRTDDFCRTKNEKELARKPPTGKAHVEPTSSTNIGEDVPSHYSHTRHNSAIIRADSLQSSKPRWK